MEKFSEYMKHSCGSCLVKAMERTEYDKPGKKLEVKSTVTLYVNAFHKYILKSCH